MSSTESASFTKKRIGLGAHQGIEAVVAKVDMEMLRLARLVTVVVELHIFGRIGTGRFELIATLRISPSSFRFG